MQAYLVLALLFSIGVAVFAVQNASTVDINLFIWQLQGISLVLVIFGSALIGAAAAGLFGLVKQIKLKKSTKKYKAQAEELQQEIGYLKKELQKLQDQESTNPSEQTATVESNPSE